MSAAWRILTRCARVLHPNVIWAQLDQSAKHAAELMRQHDIGFLPICNERGIAVGVVTDRDLATRVCAVDSRPSEVALGDVMTAPVVCCHPRDPIVKVEELMVANRKQRILVVDDRGAPVGVIAVADLAAYDRYETVARTYRRIVAG